MNDLFEREEWPSPELQRLVGALIDEVITPSQWKRLEELLLDDEAARRYYISEVDLVASIEFALRLKRDAKGSMAAPCTSAHGLKAATCSGLFHP